MINQNVLEIFKNNSWLRRFLCQLIHWWPGEYWIVVNCGLPVMVFVLFLSLFIYGNWHAHYACPRTTCNSYYYFLIHLYMYLLISSFAWLSKTKRTFFFKKKMTIAGNNPFICLYTYEFWLSLCKIVRSSVILLLPLFVTPQTFHFSRTMKSTV